MRQALVLILVSAVLAAPCRAATNPTVEDDMRNLYTDWGVPFPLFTPEREAELRKKAESNAAENKQVGN